MVDFRKRALILTLAATVSVTGSFAAENYKNCLMNMEFKSAGNNEISLILNTKSQYENTVSPIRKDANTYVIMLPETDSQAPTPDLSETGNCIQSVEIRKMPYANGAKGYTKILIKTAGIVNLNANTAVYIPSAKSPQQELIQNKSTPEDNAREIREEQKTGKESIKPEPQKERKETNSRRESHINESYKQTQHMPEPTVNKDVQKPLPDTAKVAEKQPAATQVEEDMPVNWDDSFTQQYFVGMLIILIILISIYLIAKANDKLTNVLGEKLQIDIDDEKPKKQKQETRKRHKISKTINKIDATFPRTASFNLKEYTTPANEPEEQESEMNIVDLDALFKEKQESEKPKEKNLSDALDDFLSGFQFEDSELIENIQNSEDGKQDGYDEELYERLMKCTGINFSPDDIACFRKLMLSELTDDVLNNAKNYVAENPIKPVKPSPEKLLENFVIDYKIFQNITFNTDNLETLKKLISIEIDKDFIEDLRTNAQRTKNMEKEILNSKPQPNEKEEEHKILKVKDLLPNLADALKKQGNRPIESEVRAQVVYYKEGYEVNKLTMDIDLPDLSKEVKKKWEYTSIPSATVETVDQNYADSVDKISISGLPDMKDVVAHPEKYMDDGQNEFIPDEDLLLRQISNVQFKPFDDGTRNFEIINKFDDEDDEEPIPEVDIKKEFSQFSNFEVAETDDNENFYEAPDYDDFEALYNQNYVDLDINREQIKKQDTENDIKPEEKEVWTEEPVIENTPSVQETNNEIKEEFIPQNLNRTQPVVRQNRSQKSENLMNMLEKIRAERKEKIKEMKQISIKKSPEPQVKKEVTPPPVIVKCIYEGINYNIVSSASIGNDIGCHLAKSDKGYAVFAYKGNDLYIIKEYESVKSEKIFVRLSETLDDGTPRYIIKVGSNKFIADLQDGNVRYVMDL